MGDLEFSTITILIAQADGGGAAGEGGEGGGGFDFLFFLPMLVIGVLFYFMIINPERRKKKQLEETLGNLKEKQRVVTIGGIVGTIVQFSKDRSEVTLRVDEKTNTKIRVLRSAIARPLDAEDENTDHDKTVTKDV